MCYGCSRQVQGQSVRGTETALLLRQNLARQRGTSCTCTALPGGLSYLQGACSHTPLAPLLCVRLVGALIMAALLSHLS